MSNEKNKINDINGINGINEIKSEIKPKEKVGLDRLNVSIMTPEAEFLNGAAEAVILNCSDGEYEILYGHTPMVMALSGGFIAVKRRGEWEEYWATEGFAEMSGDRISVFVDNCAKTEGRLSFDEKKHFDIMQKEKQSIHEHAELKISIARTISGLKAKKGKNI